MRTFAKSQIRYSKSQRMGIFAFLVIFIILELVGYFISRPKENEQIIEVPEEVLAFQQQSSPLVNHENLALPNHPKFDPNELSADQWMQLGFSEKQVATILKYKFSLGGYFRSKEEIKNCFVITEQKFLQLEPLIEIRELDSFKKHTSAVNVSKQKPSRKAILYQEFDPNEYQLADWKEIGFSEKQAISILKYKSSLGGRFTTVEQIRQSYVISNEKFKEMKPFMVLKNKTEIKENANASKRGVKPKSELVLEKFNPNDLSHEQWIKLGFSEKQTQTIFNYKRSLGGKFKDAETLKKCYSISEEKFAELEPYLVFE